MGVHYLDESAKEHPIHVSTVKASEELGRQLMQLRYDKLELVLKGMREEAMRQVDADFSRGRNQLARHVAAFAGKLDAASDQLTRIIELCEARKQP